MKSAAKKQYCYVAGLRHAHGERREKVDELARLIAGQNLTAFAPRDMADIDPLKKLDKRVSDVKDVFLSNLDQLEQCSTFALASPDDTEALLELGYWAENPNSADEYRGWLANIVGGIDHELVHISVDDYDYRLHWRILDPSFVRDGDTIIMSDPSPWVSIVEKIDALKEIYVRLAETFEQNITLYFHVLNDGLTPEQAVLLGHTTYRRRKYTSESLPIIQVGYQPDTSPITYVNPLTAAAFDVLSLKKERILDMSDVEAQNFDANTVSIEQALRRR